VTPGIALAFGVGLTRAAIAEITPAVLGTWLFVAGKTSQQSHQGSQ
jgi:hypothetical protein